jgi:uncharacterized membrane-anchored protein
MTLPLDHAQRFELNDEVHARPPEALAPPVRMSYLALYSNLSMREQEHAMVAELAARYGKTPPDPGTSHYSVDLGPYRITWERHTEFTRYKFIVQGACEDPFADPAIAAVPAEWIANLPGQTLVAAHAALLPAGAAPDPETISRRLFDGNVLVGSSVAGGAGYAFTDFRIHGDGFSRLLAQDAGMTPRQAGRMIQRLLEIDSYRMLALLALPVARSLTPFLNRCELDLAEIMAAMATSHEQEEPRLLDRLTRLEADIEKRHAENHYRFTAAAAYHELVQRRIEELREKRIEGLQTFREFVERRLAPAIQTCVGAARRQESLSERVARGSQLLSTRVEIARQRQNQAVLESMNRRAKLQLRLQQTVEGLSVAAITYYIVGLVGYAAKALKSVGVALNADLVTGVSIPVVAILTALGVRRARRMMSRSPDVS